MCGTLRSLHWQLKSDTFEWWQLSLTHCIFCVPWTVLSSPWPVFAHKLIKAAFLDYARLLRSLGLREGAALWASRAGSAGEQLMEELFQGEGNASEAILGEDEVELGQESTEWPQKTGGLEGNRWHALWCKSRSWPLVLTSIKWPLWINFVSASRGIMVIISTSWEEEIWGVSSMWSCQSVTGVRLCLWL